MTRGSDPRRRRDVLYDAACRGDSIQFRFFYCTNNKGEVGEGMPVTMKLGGTRTKDCRKEKCYRLFGTNPVAFTKLGLHPPEDGRYAKPTVLAHGTLAAECASRACLWSHLSPGRKSCMPSTRSVC